jgi:hypothetical protein
MCFDTMCHELEIWKLDKIIYNWILFSHKNICGCFFLLIIGGEGDSSLWCK